MRADERAQLPATCAGLEVVPVSDLKVDRGRVPVGIHAVVYGRSGVECHDRHVERAALRIVARRGGHVLELHLRDERGAHGVAERDQRARLQPGRRGVRVDLTDDPAAAAAGGGGELVGARRGGGRTELGVRDLELHDLRPARLAARDVDLHRLGGGDAEVWTFRPRRGDAVRSRVDDDLIGGTRGADGHELYVVARTRVVRGCVGDQVGTAQHDGRIRLGGAWEEELIVIARGGRRLCHAVPAGDDARRVRGIYAGRDHLRVVADGRRLGEPVVARVDDGIVRVLARCAEGDELHVVTGRDRVDDLVRAAPDLGPIRAPTADRCELDVVGGRRRVADAVGTRVDHSRVLLARARRALLLIGKRDAGEQYQTHPSEVTNVHGALLAAKGLPQSPGRSQRKVSDLSRYGREALW